MKPIQIGNVTDAIWQVERPLKVAADGSGTQTLSYKCSLRAAAVTIPAYGSPNPYLPQLLAYEFETDLEAGEIAKVSITYRGVFVSDPQNHAQTEFNKSVMEAPIETHPMFALPHDNPPVSPKYIGQIERNLTDFMDEEKDWPAAVKLLFRKKRIGIESYLKPCGTFKISYVSKNIPPGSMLAGVGYVGKPPPPCPSAPAGQNYLFMGAPWKKQGGVVEITMEFQLSGPGGWDPDLYHPPGGALDFAGFINK